MARDACNDCRFSALCLSGGFDEAYVRLLRERMPSTYKAMSEKDELIPLDIVVAQVISQVVRQFPALCPEKPAAANVSVDTLDHGWLQKPTIHIRLRNQVYGVSLV